MAKITRYRGDTSADQIIVTDSNGAVIDITGYVFVMTINSHIAPSSTEGLMATVTGVVASAIAGLVEFVPTTTAADQVPGVYYYDIQMIDTSNRISTLIKDKYQFKQDITK